MRRDSGEDADCTPDRDEDANTQKPVRTTGSELARLTLGCDAAPVLDDRIDIADHHGEAERQCDLLDEDIEVKDLFHGSDGTSVWAYIRAVLALAVMRTEEQPPSTDLRASTRRGTLSVVMWVFGLSTTLLLVGLWGRAVVVDETTIAESARVVVDAEVAQDRIYDWIGDAISETQNVGNDQASAVIALLRDRPEVSAAIDVIVDEFVAALFAPEGGSTVVDIQEAIAPVLPVVVDELSAQNVAVDEGLLFTALEDASAIEFDTGDAAGVAAVVRDAQALVSRVVAFALLTMMLSGASAIALSTL